MELLIERVLPLSVNSECREYGNTYDFITIGNALKIDITEAQLLDLQADINEHVITRKLKTREQIIRELEEV